MGKIKFQYLGFLLSHALRFCFDFKTKKIKFLNISEIKKNLVKI